MPIDPESLTLNDLFRQLATAFLNEDISVNISGASISVSSSSQGTLIQTVSFTSATISNLSIIQTVSLYGALSTVNSTSAALNASATYTGTAEPALLYNSISVMVVASHDSAANGLAIEQSFDGTNWSFGDYTTVIGGEPILVTVDLIGQYFRISLTNGGTTQTSLLLETRKDTKSTGRFSGRSNAPSLFATLAATTTNNATLVSAPGTSLSILLRNLSVTNEASSQGRIAVKDGSSSFYEMVLGASGAGFERAFPNGKRLTKNTALNVSLNTSGLTVYVNAEYVIVKS